MTFRWASIGGNGYFSVINLPIKNSQLEAPFYIRKYANYLLVLMAKKKEDCRKFEEGYSSSL